MADNLKIIKELRSKGATIRMMDDVALHVGGYESPVFIATVEFILKLKDIVKGISRPQQQSIAVSGDNKQVETAQVDFNAAKSAVGNDDELPEDVRKKMLEELHAIEAKKDSYLDLNVSNFKGIEEPLIVTGAPRRKKDKSKQNSLLERMFKSNAAQTAQRNAQKRSQQLQEDEQHQTGVQNAQRNAQRQQQAQRNAQNTNNTRQATNRSRLSQIRMRLATSLRMGGDRTAAILRTKNIGQAHGHEEHHEHDHDMHDEHHDHGHEKTGHEVNGHEHKTQEVNISKLIDEAVKAKKVEKSNIELKPQREKGEFEKKHGEKAGPRANEENVAKMAAKEAIAKLQSSGVKTATAVDPKIKAEIDAQAHNNAQTQNQQKQR